MRVGFFHEFLWEIADTLRHPREITVMSQCSLFKEVAQRIVQRAQFSENDSAQSLTSRALSVPGSGTATPTQMLASTLPSNDCVRSPTDTSPAPHR